MRSSESAYRPQQHTLAVHATPQRAGDALWRSERVSDGSCLPQPLCKGFLRTMGGLWRAACFSVAVGAMLSAIEVPHFYTFGFA